MGEHGFDLGRRIEQLAIAATRGDHLHADRQAVAAAAAGDRDGGRHRMVDERREDGVAARLDRPAANRLGAEAVVAEPVVTEPVAEEAAPDVAAEEPPAKPKRTRRKKADVEPAAQADDAVATAADVETAAAVADEAVSAEVTEADEGAARRGWWQRTFGN